MHGNDRRGSSKKPQRTLRNEADGIEEEAKDRGDERLSSADGQVAS
jgi:hypothetical protein